MARRHAVIVSFVSTALLGCAPRTMAPTTPARPEPRASDYVSLFELPDGIEVALDCPAFTRLAEFVSEASELMSHYRSPNIQVCAGTTIELD